MSRRPFQDMNKVSRLDDLLRPEVLEAFDCTSFERDGYWVWEGILTDAGRKQWTASLQKLQKMSDDMVMRTDWEAIDYAGRGLKPLPPEKITIGDGSAVTPEFLQQQVVRTLCYPEGTPVEYGGEVAVIPGAHLYRIPYKWNRSHG